MDSPPATRQPLSRPLKIALWVVGILLAIPLIAIIVLLIFMLMMNGLAIYLRNRFERRW